MIFEETGPHIQEFKEKVDIVLHLVQDLSGHMVDDEKPPTIEVMLKKIKEISDHREEFLLEYDNLLNFYHTFKNKEKTPEEEEEFIFIESFWEHVEPGIFFFKMIMDQIPTH